MEAYIEYVIWDNFTMDLLIMLIALNALRMKIDKLRVLLSAALGTTGAVLMPIVPFYAAIIIRIISAPLMCLIAVRLRTLKEYILILLVMVTVTFALGGAVMGIFNMSVKGNFLIMHYPDGGVIGLSALAVILVYYGIKQLGIYMKSRRIDRELYDVILNNSKLKAFYDSGNNLYDNQFRPVLILSNEHKDLLNNLKTGEKITINTIKGAYQSDSYILDKLLIYINGQVNTIYNVSCAASEISFGHYDLLLHREMIKEG